MINIDNVCVYGFEAAIRGMRNPLNSWEKSDTETFNKSCLGCPYFEKCLKYTNGDGVCTHIGANDIDLMKRLVLAGTDHSKFMRFINVTCDIVAPLYWWKEYDTYKVGTVANSCSTMHKIQAKRFTLDDFSHEYLEDVFIDGLKETIRLLNIARDGYNSWDEKCLVDKKSYWWQMIQLLPSSYNQRRTVQLNYQVLRNMYFARRNHKLDCWITFCEWIETLPYAMELICNGGEEELEN